MRFYKNKINNKILWLIFFLGFLGYYSILLVVFNIGMSEQSRLVTVPIRILILILFLALFFNNQKHLKIRWQTNTFLFFISIYLLRVLIDYSRGLTFYTTYSDLLFYLFAFVIVPYLTLSVFKVNTSNLNSIVKALLIPGFIFSTLGILSYRQFIGEVGRLGIGDEAETVISPLTLSYCSTLIIGITSIYLFYNKVSLRVNIFGIITILLSIVPFFLGASRGSLFSLFLPFLFIFFASKKLMHKIRYLIFFIAVLILLVYLDQNLGSGLIDRFTNISSDIEEGNSSAVRIIIWKTALNQFLTHPILGDKLQIGNDTGYYAHNLTIEILQTTGLLGFIPFVFLVLSCFRASFKLFKYNPKYAWVSVIFIQSFMQYSFSGALYLSSWLWTSMALVISVESQIMSSHIKKVV